MVERADRLLTYDIGGSHISAALCLLEPLTVIEMAVAPLPETISGDAFFDLVQDLGRQLMGGVAHAAGACLAFPGPFSYPTGVSHLTHKLAALYGVDLRAALARRFGWQPGQVRFLNDADAALLGEVGAGAARGAARVVGIMLGTGIGFAFVRDGILNSTDPFVPADGEIYHLPFLDGIVEDVLSSRGIERHYEARTARREPVDAIARRADVDADADADARAVFTTFGRYLGQVIREILAPIGPEVIVFGGGISRSSHLFLPAARNQIDGTGIRLVPSMLKAKAPMLGAAMFWRDCASAEAAGDAAGGAAMMDAV